MLHQSPGINFWIYLPNQVWKKSWSVTSMNVMHFVTSGSKQSRVPKLSVLIKGKNQVIRPTWLVSEPTQTGRRATRAAFLPKKLKVLEMRLKGTQQSELHGELQGASARSSISNTAHKTQAHLPGYNGKLEEHNFIFAIPTCTTLAHCKHL